MLRVQIRPGAAAQIEDVVDYYTNASPAVARRFISALQSAIDLLAQNPQVGSPRFSHLLPGRGLRFWKLTRFPFRLFYTVDQTTLEVIAVDHERRRPKRGL
ncbi:type II toxin-antitoxin system RelE/ParE family toxin [Massilia sp. YIM B04103]|uniref:type II toxin-antitoxin system RelE/ParE family toxin n=1 Tax=Massilia sp. YIM B04103 TaxID=2963106 RepID=UPI0035A5AAEB